MVTVNNLMQISGSHYTPTQRKLIHPYQKGSTVLEKLMLEFICDVVSVNMIRVFESIIKYFHTLDFDIKSEQTNII